jgi:hypothetical protein
MQLLLILTLCASLVSGILVKFNTDAKPAKHRSHLKNLDTNKLWPN